MGASLTINNTEINSTFLNQFDIIVIEQGGTSWSTNELNDLVNWVNAGGSVYILGDDLDPPQLNVSGRFNIYYNSTDPIAGDITNLDHQYPILNGVVSLYAFFSSASINTAISTSQLMNLALTNDSAVILAALQVNLVMILINIDADGMIRDGFIDSGGSENHLLANNSWLWLADLIGNGNSSFNPPDGNLDILVLSYLLSNNTFNLPLIYWIIILSLVAIGVIFTITLIRKRKSQTVKDKDKN